MMKAVLPELPNQELHFLVVANSEPRKDPTVYLVLVTSQGATNRKLIELWGADPKTLVTIPNLPTFDGQTKESYVNCNTVFQKTKAEFMEMLERKRTVKCQDMPAAVMDQIARGIVASRRVPEAVKRAVTA